VGLSSDVVAPLSVDVEAHVVTMTVGISAQFRQSDAVSMPLQEEEEDPSAEVWNSYGDIGHITEVGQLVTVAVAMIVVVLRDNGEHVKRVKVIVLT
jgi:hypothetical protein